MISDATIAKSLPKGFSVDHGSFVGPVTVMNEAKSEGVSIRDADVRAVYHTYTPSKAAATRDSDSLDEKYDDMAGSAASLPSRTPEFCYAKSSGDSPLSVSSCSVSSSSPAEDVAERARPVLIVIDNDECIGSWGDLSMLYTVFTHVLHQDPSVELFARLLNDTGCVRPGLRELYDSVLELKSEGGVCGVFMCTAARDTVGWVTFLRRVLEVWYGKPVYDGVIEGNMIHEWHQQNGSAPTDHMGSVFKNMNQVRSFAGVAMDTPVVAIDDRPDNILHGEAIRVPAYTVAVNLIEVARLFVPEWNGVLEQRYGHTLQESWRTYQRNPARYTVAWMDVAMTQSAATVRSKVAAFAAAASVSVAKTVVSNVMCDSDDDMKECL